MYILGTRIHIKFLIYIHLFLKLHKLYSPKEYMYADNYKATMVSLIRALSSSRLKQIYNRITIIGGLVTQAVRRSPPTAEVPSSRLGHSMWVSWWTKRGLGRFFAGFLPFSPTKNFISPFIHTHLIHFVSFYQPL